LVAVVADLDTLLVRVVPKLEAVAAAVMRILLEVLWGVLDNNRHKIQELEH
jgi:hypothetical protein